MAESYQWFDEHAEAAMRRAVEPVLDYDGRTGPTPYRPDGGAHYDCEECGSFNFLPEHLRCPLCDRRLSGTVTLNFELPYPESSDGE